MGATAHAQMRSWLLASVALVAGLFSSVHALDARAGVLQRARDASRAVTAAASVVKGPRTLHRIANDKVARQTPKHAGGMLHAKHRRHVTLPAHGPLTS